MAAGESEFLHELEAEVVAELSMAQLSHPEQALDASPAEWLYDPTDVEREEIGLRSILGAVEAVEREPDPASHPPASNDEEGRTSDGAGRLPRMQ